MPGPFKSKGDTGQGYGIQDVLSAAFHRIAGAFRVIIYGYDGVNYQPVFVKTNGTVVVTPYPVAQASAILNAAGSATFVAGSAGYTKVITDIQISSKKDDVVVFIKSGLLKLTPTYKFKDGGGAVINFSGFARGSAGTGVKLSATTGSAVATINWFHG